jgi:hypothetical protein
LPDFGRSCSAEGERNSLVFFVILNDSEGSSSRDNSAVCLVTDASLRYA